MTRRQTILGAACLVGLFCLTLALTPGGAPQPQLATDFKAEDEIRTLAVTIEVGAGGADLEEPVALDLGLGFPFWLHPVGRRETDNVPFGAVPQETNVNTRITAGTRATFTFSLDADTGQDEFHTTSQLLKGIRVADISRVGFASAGTSSWILAGYEIQINGKVFAAKTNGAAAQTPEGNQQKLAELDQKIVPVQTELADLQALAQAKLATPDDLKRLADVEATLKTLLADRSKLVGQDQGGAQAKAVQDAARGRLADLNAKIAPLREQWVSMRQLAQAQLAEDADRQRLKELEGSLAPLMREKARLEGQLQGTYPWFEDKTFQSPWRAEQAIQSARVTVVTASHPGADTRNYVYFRTGGHRYLLGSPTRLLMAGSPQVFQLDLLAGPLTSADLRGWALGMLGQPEPFGTAPDRWHPARLMVEIDGKIVYDSEGVQLDRQSLAAIRLIPPAHRELGGNVVTNTPNAREAFVWEAGKALGVQPDSGQALDLPAQGDPQYPPIEPGLPEQPPADQPPVTDDTPPYFPGEQPQPGSDLPPDVVIPPPPPDVIVPPDGMVPGGMVPGGIVPGGTGMGPWPWPDGGGTGGFPPGGWPPDWLLPPGWNPPPAGPPPQIDNVRITSGWRTSDNFTIAWTVTGDETAVDHYEVSLLQMRPTNAVVIGTEYPLPGTAPRGSTSLAGVPAGLAGVVDPGLFLAPVVKFVPVDPTQMTEQTVIGPARMIFPPTTTVNPLAQPTLGNGPLFLGSRFTFRWGNPAPPPWFGLLISAAPPPGAGRAVWPAGEVVSDNAIRFESPGRGTHVGVRPQMGDTIQVYARAPLFGGQRRVVAHIGFIGGAGATGSVTGALQCRWEDAAGDAVSGPLLPAPPVRTAVAGNPMPPPLTQLIDSATAPGGTAWLGMRVSFTGGPFDPAHPPALLGVRLVPN